MLTTYRPNPGTLFALVTACGLGAITTQAKVFYADGGNALTMMLVRFVASTLVFGLILLLRKTSFRVDRDKRLPLAALGFVWSGATICYLTSVEFNTARLTLMNSADVR